MAVNQRTGLRLKTALNLAQALTTDFIERRQSRELRGGEALGLGVSDNTMLMVAATLLAAPEGSYADAMIHDELNDAS